MGFRSTLTVEDKYLPLPKWFVEKWSDRYHMGDLNGEPNLPIFSKDEAKWYADFEDEPVFKDIQKLMPDEMSIGCILFHECGGITKVVIDKTEIYGLEPSGWKKTDGVTHNYCYGCSEEDKERLNSLLKE